MVGSSCKSSLILKMPTYAVTMPRNPAPLLEIGAHHAQKLGHKVR
jgi:hypothetical protein